MVDKIEFTRNHSDLSTGQGFQFEFFCDRCGTGFRTPFKAWVVGSVAGMMDAANSLFGGVFGKAADMSERVRSAAWETAHDQAFNGAMKEIKSDFMQCPRCSTWVCRKSCWNQERGLCKNCAPQEAVEMAAAQASMTKDKIWESAQIAEADQPLMKAESYAKKLKAACSNCGASLLPGAKFCAECGAKVQVVLHCTECGLQLRPEAKFCPSCGTKVVK